MMRIMDILLYFVFISSAYGEALDNACASYSSDGVCLLSLAIHKDPRFGPRVGIFGYEDSEDVMKKDSAGHCRGFRIGSDGLPTLKPLAVQRGAKFMLEADATPAKCEETCLADSDCRFFSWWSGGDAGPEKAVCASFKSCKESKRQKSEEFQTWRKRRTKSETEATATPSPTEAAEVTPSPTVTLAEEEQTYYYSESYYSLESYYSSSHSSEEEQVTLAPTPPPTEAKVTPAPTPPPTEAEDETYSDYYTSDCYYSPEASDDSSEEEQVSSEETYYSSEEEEEEEKETYYSSSYYSSEGEVTPAPTPPAAEAEEETYYSSEEESYYSSEEEEKEEEEATTEETYYSSEEEPYYSSEEEEKEEEEATTEETYYSSESYYSLEASSEEEQVTPAPTPPPTEAEDETYYSSESYYSSEASDDSSEEEQLTPAPTPPPTLPGCFTAVPSRVTNAVNPCVDAGHYDIIDPAICADAIIEDNTRKGMHSPSWRGNLNEDSMRRGTVDYGFKPYGCFTKNRDGMQAYMLNLRVDGSLQSRNDPKEYLTYCCIPKKGCPCGAEEETEAEDETYYSSDSYYYSSD